MRNSRSRTKSYHRGRRAAAVKIYPPPATPIAQEFVFNRGGARTNPMAYKVGPIRPHVFTPAWPRPHPTTFYPITQNVLRSSAHVVGAFAILSDCPGPCPQPGAPSPRHGGFCTNSQGCRRHGQPLPLRYDAPRKPVCRMAARSLSPRSKDARPHRPPAPGARPHHSRARWASPVVCHTQPGARSPRRHAAGRGQGSAHHVQQGPGSQVVGKVYAVSRALVTPSCSAPGGT